MTQPESDINTAKSRRHIYGSNLALMIVVALMILIMIMIAVVRQSQKSRLGWDISSSGMNSLSGQSTTLLKEINEKKQNYHIVSLFTDPSNEEKSRGDPNKQAEKRQQVMDLLNLYRKQSPFVQVDDWGDRARDEIDREIREKYAAELKPYQEAVEGFDAVSKAVQVWAPQEAERLGAAVQGVTTTAEEREFLGQLQSKFRDLEPTFDEIQRAIHRETESVLPEWDGLTAEIKEVVESFEPFLSLLAEPKMLAETTRMPKALIPYFNDANPRYKQVSSTVKNYIDRLSKLPKLEVKDVLAGVGRNTVVVLGPTSAKVIMRDQMFEQISANSDPLAGPPPTRFKGEETISSALLGMARPDKVKVVFVTSQPARILANHTNISDMLSESNFEVLEWAPPGGMTPDSPDATPPAQGKGSIWVVFPPEQQQQQMFMMPSDPRPVIAAVQKHLSLGGQVLFLAEAAGNSMMGPSDKYPYEELLTPFGIQVKPKYTVVLHTDRVDPNTNRRVEGFEQFLLLTRFEDHPITDPMQSLPTVFFPSGELTVVDIARPAPEGAEPKIIVRTPNDPNYWGESSFTAARPSLDPQTDIPAPVPVVSVSVRNRGKADEQRAVVIGTKYIGVDGIFRAIVPRQRGNQVSIEYLYPGNRELIRNSILWLAGYENMISVSPRANAGSRLLVSGSGLAMLRTTMILIVPLAVLLVGVLVWVKRHR